MNTNIRQLKNRLGRHIKKSGNGALTSLSATTKIPISTLSRFINEKDRGLRAENYFIIVSELERIGV
jgi:hypothetical protein